MSQILTNEIKLEENQQYRHSVILGQLLSLQNYVNDIERYVCEHIGEIEDIKTVENMKEMCIFAQCNLSQFFNDASTMINNTIIMINNTIRVLSKILIGTEFDTLGLNEKEIESVQTHHGFIVIKLNVLSNGIRKVEGIISKDFGVTMNHNTPEDAITVLQVDCNLKEFLAHTPEKISFMIEDVNNIYNNLVQVIEIT